MPNSSKTTIANLEADLNAPTPWTMGVLNITPDSFSDGGKFFELKSALHQFDSLRQDGADIIDIGGESTGPGRGLVSAEEEVQRILPIVSACASKGLVSVDTYKRKTAELCLKAGARMINDVSALRADKDLAGIVREHNAYLVMMYSKEEDDHPHASLAEKDYANIIHTITEFFHRRIDYALKQGIKSERIILDPGMGRFLSHDEKYSWEILRKLQMLSNELAPFPLLIGVSRKGFLGGSLKDRDPLSQLASLHAALSGAKLIRTHCPKMAKQFWATWHKLRELT